MTRSDVVRHDGVGADCDFLADLDASGYNCACADPRISAYQNWRGEECLTIPGPSVVLVMYRHVLRD
jgi:hypothetical protein